MGWIIFAGIVFAVLLILMIPVHVVAEWDRKLALRIHYLFLKFTVFPVKVNKKEKKEKKGSTKKAVKKKEKKRKKYLDEIVDGILDFIEKYGGGAKMALKNIRVHYLEGFWKITDEDAAECAVKYGRACAGVNVILAFIQNYIRIEKIKLKIYPDFASEKDEIRIKADIEFNPLIVIIGLLRIATVFFKDIFFKQHKTEKMKVKECI